MRRVVCRLAAVGQRRRPGPRPDLLEPDIVLPGQFSGVRDMPAQGERALMLAVLEMAIRDLRLFAGSLQIADGFPAVVTLQVARREHWRVKRARGDLIQWFRSDDREWPFSFVPICETFGLDPDAVRKRLEQRGWRPARSPSHMHATAQQPRQLHGGYHATP